MSRPEWIKRETSASVTRARAIERLDMSARTMTTKVSVASAARVVDGRRARRAVGSRSARVVARAGDSWGPCSCHGGAHLSAERKADQAAVDGKIKCDAMMAKYLKATFSLSKRDMPHKMIF